MNVLLAESVLVPVLMAGPPLLVCCWLLWRTVRPFAAVPKPMTPGPSARRSRWAVACCAAAVYGAALLLPTAAPFNAAYSTTTYPGYDAFRLWKVLFLWEPGSIDWWVLSLGWLANPAIWIAIALTAAGRPRPAGVAAGCGLVLGLAPLPWYFPMVAGLPGYWAWVGSAGLVLAAGVAQWHRAGGASEIKGGFAADYDDAVSPPNRFMAPSA